MSKEIEKTETADRKAELHKIFEGVDASERALVDNLINEVVYYEREMEELKRLPFIAVHPLKAQMQKLTPAAKLYKEYATSYMNAIRILLNILRKVETSAADDLMKRLEDYM